jgi:poly(A) polymerase
MSTADQDPALAVPELSTRLARQFRRAGHDLYLVGGSVRDRLFGAVDTDLDFATSAPPEETGRLLNDLGASSVYRVGERFGTVGARFGETVVEITTYRSGEVYMPESRKPAVEFGKSLSEDLHRRDFTVNAIALDPLTDEVIDPFDGRADLSRRLIRAVGDPAERFREDPLRMLRAVRFAARLEFAIEERTWKAIGELAASVASISRERIRDEYSRILTTRVASRGITMLRDSGLLAATVPQLLELTSMPDHGPRHPLSLWDHTMRTLDAVPPDLVVRWAALLHDVAKPATRTHGSDGRPRFFHHEEVGAHIARRILHGLRYPNDLVEQIVLLVSTHMQLHSFSAEWSEGALRRLCLRLGPVIGQAIQLARADAGAHTLSGRGQNAPRLDFLEERLLELSQEPPETTKSPLSGDDLIARYGRPPGKWIGEIKDALEGEVIEGRLRPDDREAAWAIADRMVGSHEP